jgi:hypothetical protein
MADTEPLPFDATGLHALWAMRTHRAPPVVYRDMREHLLLDALGLGLEQTITYLGSERPDYAAFLAWVVATAGMPDPLTLARYEATLSGAPLPAPIQAQLAAIDAMPPALDAGDLAQWDTQGYVVLRGAISSAEAETAAALLWETSAARPDDPDSWYRAERNQGIMVQRFQHSALEPARRAPRVHKAFAQLWGTSDLWSSIDRMSFSPPERPGYAFRAPRLHWDVSLARPIPFATQGILYLTETNEDQGALELVPGFHHRIDAWLDGLGDSDPRGVDLGAEAVRVPGKAGDLVIWRQDLPHGASPNRSTRPRLAQYVNRYAPTLTRHAEWR